MPVYEYKCECGEEFQIPFPTFKSAEPHIDGTTCDKCGKLAERVLSPSTFHLHGSPEGWYRPSPAAKRVVNPDSATFFDGPKKGG